MTPPPRGVARSVGAAPRRGACFVPSPMKLRHILDHALMLQDQTRMRAYQKAIRSTCEGRTVCEVGVGFGPLSLMALRAGAAKVYGIEHDAETLALATEVIRANGFDESRFVPIKGLSTRVELPERVDVLISETLDSMGIGESALPFLSDASRRFLKPGGVMIPSRLECHVALACPAVYRARRDLWAASLGAEYGLRYGVVADRVRSLKHTIPVAPDEVMSEWQRWQSIDLANPSTFLPVSPALFVPERAGEALGLAFAFDVTLAGDVRIRTRPDDAPTHWHQGFHAFAEAVKVSADDAVYAELVTAPESFDDIRFEVHVASGPKGEVAKLVNERLAALAGAAAR